MFNIWATFYWFLHSHFENTPIQIYWKFYNQKRENFQIKNSDIFHISAQNIDCGYSLEPPRRGGSNEYPQSMFLSRNKKNNVYPCKVLLYKSGVSGGGQNYIGVFSWWKINIIKWSLPKYCCKYNVVVHIMTSQTIILKFSVLNNSRIFIRFFIFSFHCFNGIIRLIKLPMRIILPK